MSDTDTFIDEVTEQVRNDKLFAAYRKYGWIAGLLVAVIVGGAVVNEWQSAKTRSAAQDRGDALLAAMDGATNADRVAALDALSIDGEAGAVLALLTASETDDPKVADAALAGLAADEAMPRLYRDLATLKRVILPGGDLPPETRFEMSAPLAIAGGPFRVIAEEQMALAELEMGDNDGALARLSALLEDADASEGLRTRAEQLIVALGGEAVEADVASE